MKRIILIDDNKNILSAINGFDVIGAADCKLEPCLIAKSILSERIENHHANRLVTIAEKDTIIFINIDGVFGNSKRQSQKGVEILMWLRCKYKVNNPVILYSFQSNHELLKARPEHLIINSKGCYYYQLPYNFSELIDKQLKGIESDSDWNLIKKYLKPAFSIEEFRHLEANWWGIKQLCDVHYALDNSLNFDREKNYPLEYKGYYPRKINEELNNLRNCIASFIFGKTIEQIENAVQARELERLGRDKVVFLEELIEKKPNPKKDISLGTVGQQIFHWRGVTRLNPEFTSRLEAALFEKLRVEKTIEDIDKKISLLTHDSLPYLLSGKELPIISNSIRILHVDDQWADGWGEIFCRIIYTDEFIECIDKTLSEHKWNDKFISIKPTARMVDAFKTYCEQFADELYSNFVDFDLIMLDLRLMPEEDIYIEEIRGLSGAILLQAIRKKFKALPIIMTTASNKVWSYEQVINLGADGYWIKEGLDLNYSNKETLANYIKLIELITKVTSHKYQYVKKIEYKVNSIVYKLQTSQIYNGTNTRINDFQINDDFKRAVGEILANSVFLLKDYLFSNVINQNELIDEELRPIKENSFLCTIVNNLGNVIEIIYSKGVYNPNLIKNLSSKNEHSPIIVVKMRNAASHFLNSKIVTFNELKSFLSFTITWLDNNFFSLNKNFSGLDNKTPQELANVAEAYLQQDATLKTYFDELNN